VIKSIERTAKPLLCALIFLLSTRLLSAQATPASASLTPFQSNSAHLPWEFGAIAQGGFGLTQDRSSFKFLMVGAHAGKVLTGNFGPGLLNGNFEYAVEVFPFWQSYTPKFQRVMCTAPNTCSAPYTVGGTFTGASITPIILRWNFKGSRRITPWVQGGGGVLWTNHKYPAFGGLPYNTFNDGKNSDASVWNFTPQGGIGAHYFIKPSRSIDFGLNAVHISSASLGDKNPGVNASLQFSLGYTWWK
jgi:lipid A 3-O-deacylase